VRRLLADGGVGGAEVELEEAHQPLRRPEDFWTVVQGGGLRWTTEQLGARLAQEVRDEVLAALAAAGTRRIATHAIYALARKV